MKEQVEVLDRGASLVKSGGRLAYITCSVLDEENSGQVRAFVERHPEFSVEKPTAVTNLLGERAYLFQRAAKLTDEGALMTPRRTDTDGFFVSVLKRS
jgi:16S rRNA (cytosine967-C5)-methyltransferase